MIEVVVLGSGSAGNSTLVRRDGRAVLVDAGFSARELKRRLAAVGQPLEGIEAIVVTHEHGDHVRGLEVFARACRATIFATPGTVRCAKSLWELPRLVEIAPNQPFEAGPFRATPFPIPHDAAQPVGYVLEADGTRVGYATDLGHVPASVEAALDGCAALVFEANHDREMLINGPYPWETKQRIGSAYGHLSNDHAAAALPALAAEGAAVVLAHLSEKNNNPQLARAAVETALRAAGRARVRLTLAAQGEPAAPIRL